MRILQKPFKLLTIPKKQHLARAFAGLMIFAAISGALELVVLRPDRVGAVAQGDGMVVYGEGTVSAPRYRDYLASSNLYDIEGTGATAAANVRHVITKSSIVRNEMITGLQTSTGSVYIQRFDGVKWNAEWNASVGGDGALPRFDIIYEQSSGNALVVYGNGNSGANAELSWQLWNGTSWSSGTFNSARIASSIQAVQMEVRSGSDEAVVAFADGGNDLSAAYWNPSTDTFGGEHSVAFTTTLASHAASATPNTWSFDVAFESLSGEALLVWGVGTGVDLSYATRTSGTSGTWTVQANYTTPAEQVDDCELASDPNSNYIAYVNNSTDSGNDGEAAMWSGTAWGDFNAFDATMDALRAGTSNNAINWVRNGTQDRAVLTYDDNNNAGVEWKVFNKNTATWAANVATATAPTPVGTDDEFHRLRPNPYDSSQLTLLVVDANDDLFTKGFTFDGSTTTSGSTSQGVTIVDRTSGTVYEDTLSTPDGFRADFAYKKFVTNPTYNQSSYRWFNNSDVTNGTTFINGWGGTGSDTGRAMDVGPDGSIYVSGNTASFGTGGDVFLTKYSASGELIWNRTWGGTLNETGYGVAVDSSGNVYVAGNSSSSGMAGEYDVLLLKYDSDGNMLWNKMWGESDYNAAFHLAIGSDGGIYVVGMDETLNGNINDVLIVKFDSSGSVLWNQTWGGSGDDRGLAVSTDSSGGIYVAGMSASVAATTESILLKFDTNGNLTWDKSWGGAGTDVGYGVDVSADGSIYVSGETGSFGTTANGVFLAKYDSSGGLTWDKTWDGTGADTAFATDTDPSGNIYVTGSTASFGAVSTDAFVSKYDASGNLTWNKMWGSTGAEVALRVEAAREGVYVAGYSASYGAGSDEVILAKYDASGAISGCSGTNCQTPSATSADPSATTGTPADTLTSLSGTTATPTAVQTNPGPTTTSIVALAQDSVDVGGALNSVAQDTATTAPAEGTPFRLRLNLHVTVDPAIARVQEFKLQYAQRGSDNLCDTSFSGESFEDVGATTPISYYNEQKSTDGASLVTNANDPTHSSDTLVRQEYQAGGIFGIKNQIPTGQDGMWDLALVDNGAPSSTTYCLRVVKSDGTTLSYSVVPQITSTDASLTQSNWRWFENAGASSETGVQVWGASSLEDAYAVIQTSDGGYAVTGHEVSFGVSGDMYLAKYDSGGSLTWDVTWGGGATDWGYSLAETTDGGIVVAGEDQSFGTATDAFLVKYDSSGNLLWDAIWGGTNTDRAYAVAATDDGGCIMVGQTVSFGITGDVFLAKYDSSGNLSWDLNWAGGLGVEEAKSVIQTTDGGYAVTGNSTSFGNSDQMFLAKFTSSGALSWNAHWGGSSQDYGYSVVETTDGGYAITGRTDSFGTAGSMFLAKYTSSGSLSWDTIWGGSGMDIGNSVVQTADGGFAVAGDAASFGTSGSMFLAKYDSAGTLSWDKTWGGSGTDRGYSLVHTADGGFMVTGDTDSFGAGNSDMFLAKYDSSGTISGCSGANCADPSASTADPAATTGNTLGSTGNPSASTSSPTATIGNPTFTTTHLVGVPGSFIKSLGSTGAERGRSVVQASDGGYVVAGQTTTFGGGSNDIFVAKYDSSGTLSWNKTWGGSGSDLAYSIIQASDGGYAVTGSTSSFGGGMFLIKYDATGNIVWQTTWGDGGEMGYSVAQTSEGGFVVTGETSLGGATNDNVFLLKYDSSGTFKWSKTWALTGTDNGWSVVHTTDGGFAVAGVRSPDDMILLKYDQDGNLTWNVNWGGVATDVGLSLVQTSDGGYAVAGHTNSFGVANKDAFLVKFDSSGNVSWNKTWGGASDEEATGVVQSTDGALVIAGYSSSFNGSAEMFLAKFDLSGALISDRVWGGAGLEVGLGLSPTSDGGVVVTGYTSSSGYGTSEELFLVKYNSALAIPNCSGTNCQDPSATVTTPSATTGTPSATLGSPVNTVFEPSGSVTVTTPSATSTTVVAAGGSFALSYIGVKAPKALQNTVFKLSQRGDVVRLRLLIEVANKALPAGRMNFKLQAAPKVGTCDASFTGETFADVATSGTASVFYDNSATSSGRYFAASPLDPTGGNTVVRQTYIESNNFTSIATIPDGQDGAWDFPVSSGNLSSGGTYCFRVVKSDGSPLVSYDTVPELWIPPSQDRTMRHGQFFSDGGEEDPYYW